MTNNALHRSAWLPTALIGSAMLSACGADDSSSSVGSDAGTTVVSVQPAPAAPSSPSGTSSSTPGKVLSTVPKFELGVNLATSNYYSGEPLLANLATGDLWKDGNWQLYPSARVDALGNIRLGVGERAYRMLTPPAAVMTGQGVTVRCTWEGEGDAWVNGAKTKDVALDHGWEFFWTGTRGLTGDRVWLEVKSSSQTDPIRNFDCREKGVAKSEIFASEFLESLKPYGVLRYLDWSNVNGNPAKVTWADRTRADSIDQAFGSQGIALEYMVALANRMDADPWFNIPWNADEDYVRRMAQLVHDGIPGHRHVYVELSNEVWNYYMPVTRQAQSEGEAAGLAPGDGFKSAILRYAQKSRWALAIWRDVFKDRPGQLVRVAATQFDNPWTAEVVLGEGKLAEEVDALAVAPYFGADLFQPGRQKGVTDIGILMGALAARSKEVLADVGEKNAAVARKYGKRYIAYEAGQHVGDDNIHLVSQINRSDAMYDIYKNYIADWKSRFNDTMMLFNSSGQISAWGAWGLREYAGQPLAETPKRRAAVEFAR